MILCCFQRWVVFSPLRSLKEIKNVAEKSLFEKWQTKIQAPTINLLLPTQLASIFYKRNRVSLERVWPILVVCSSSDTNAIICSMRAFCLIIIGWNYIRSRESPEHRSQLSLLWTLIKVSSLSIWLIVWSCGSFNIDDVMRDESSWT